MAVAAEQWARQPGFAVKIEIALAGCGRKGRDGLNSFTADQTGQVNNAMDSTSRIAFSISRDIPSCWLLRPARTAPLLASALWLMFLPGTVQAREAPSTLFVCPLYGDQSPPSGAPSVDVRGIRDERLWTLLMEEPSAYLRLSHERLQAQDYPAAASHLRRVGAYLQMASGTAARVQQLDLQQIAEDLCVAAETLAQQAAGGLAAPHWVLPVFVRAESALAADHQAKAASALAEGRAQVAGHYLSASLHHLESARRWAGQGSADFQPLRPLAEGMIQRPLEALGPADDGVNWVRGEVARLEPVLGSAAMAAGSAWIPLAGSLYSRLRF